MNNMTEEEDMRVCPRCEGEGRVYRWSLWRGTWNAALSLASFWLSANIAFQAQPTELEFWAFLPLGYLGIGRLIEASKHIGGWIELRTRRGNPS